MVNRISSSSFHLSVLCSAVGKGLVKCAYRVQGLIWPKESPLFYLNVLCILLGIVKWCIKYMVKCAYRVIVTEG